MYIHNINERYNAYRFDNMTFVLSGVSRAGCVKLCLVVLFYCIVLYTLHDVHTIDTAILQRELRMYCNEIETCTANEIEITYGDIIIRSENVY
jgi:hypothetical protein